MGRRPGTARASRCNRPTSRHRQGATATDRRPGTARPIAIRPTSRHRPSPPLQPTDAQAQPKLAGATRPRRPDNGQDQRAGHRDHEKVTPNRPRRPPRPGMRRPRRPPRPRRGRGAVTAQDGAAARPVQGRSAVCLARMRAASEPVDGMGWPVVRSM